MKKTTIALAVAIASLTSAAHAAPADGTFYFGAKTGWSSFYKTDDTREINLNDEFKVSKDRVGAGAYLGYQANPYLGFELGYDWLGKAKYKPRDGVNADAGAEFRAQGASAVIKLSYPVTQHFDLYTRLGVFIGSTQFKSYLSEEKYKSTSTSPLFAVGVQYNINDSFSTRLDYQWINKLKTKDNDFVEIKPNNGFLSLGVSYNFANILNKPAINTPIAVQPLPEVSTKETRFVLSDDVLFDYNKSTLKSQGSSQLDELVNKLTQLEPTEGHVIVIGYTDRIGGADYNKRLSLARATSVMNYLIQKGVPSSSISARGEGKANPITGSQCNSIKAGQALRNCLAPDRRVEIEITGVSQEVDIISSN